MIILCNNVNYFFVKCIPCTFSLILFSIQDTFYCPMQRLFAQVLRLFSYMKSFGVPKFVPISL
jgi:hypothetical protein